MPIRRLLLAASLVAVLGLAAGGYGLVRLVEATPPVELLAPTSRTVLDARGLTPELVMTYAAGMHA